MNRFKRVALVTLALIAGSLQADEAAMREQALAVMKPFAGQLKATLQAAIADGGVVNGIQACNLEAPGIAESASRDGWQVGRTSLKTRNPGNAPDAWERATLESFETRKAAGEAPDTLVASAVVDGEFRFMKAIPTGGLCLNCHGDAIAPETAAELDRLYPQDDARGYQLGDLRGAFTLRRTIEK